MSLSQEFKSRIGVVPIARSVFEDQNGIWAKDMTLCVRIYIEFDDDDETVVYLSREDYQSLPTDQQLLIQHAPSSPPA